LKSSLWVSQSAGSKRGWFPRFWQRALEGRVRMPDQNAKEEKDYRLLKTKEHMEVSANPP
jgi:hypothetical protein